MKKLVIAVLPALVLMACAGGSDMADTTAGMTTVGDTTAATTAGLVDPNSASQEQLMAAGLDSAAAAAVIGGRPYDDMVAMNNALPSSVDSTSGVALYRQVWKPIDLNTATDAEILLIPGIGQRMLHEFKEYRPYTDIAQFRREIGKYVDEEEVARLEQYVMVKP